MGLALIVFGLFIYFLWSELTHTSSLDALAYVINISWMPVYHHTWVFVSIGIIFVVACITDAIDGFLARKFNWISEFGKLWDPIADKILINTTLIAFAIAQLVPWPIIVLMICRDIIVDAGRIYAAQAKKTIAADIFGKLKTIFQMVALILIFFIFNNQPSPDLWYWLIQNFFIYLATIFSLISGINYMIKIYHPKHAEHKKK